MRVTFADITILNTSVSSPSGMTFIDAGYISHIKDAEGVVIVEAVIADGTETNTGLIITGTEEERTTPVMLGVSKITKTHFIGSDSPVGLPCPPYCN